MGFGRDGGRDGESGRDEEMTVEVIRHDAVTPYSPTLFQDLVTARVTDE
jgi:hypothetical protein